MKCRRCGIRIYKPKFYAHWLDNKPYHGSCYRVLTRPEFLEDIKKYQERLQKAREEKDDDDTKT